MMANRRATWAVAVSSALLATTLALATSAQARGKPTPGVVPPNGQYAELSARWWQCALAQPASRNPLLDPLEPGAHTIVFGGTTLTLDEHDDPALCSLEITYHIT